MQSVIKDQKHHERYYDRKQTISRLRQREISMAVIAHRSDSKNRHGQQEQYCRPLCHAALLCLIHWAKDITAEARAAG